MAHPFADDEDRRPDVEAERVMFVGRPVPIPHEETDQPLVGLVHLLLAAPERDAGGIDDRKITRHRVVEPDEAMVEHGDRSFGDHALGHGHATDSSQAVRWTAADRART